MNTTPAMEPLKKGARISGDDRQAVTEVVVAAYHGGRSVRGIAADLGRSFGFVHRILAEAGVKMRSRGYRGPR